MYPKADTTEIPGDVARPSLRLVVRDLADDDLVSVAEALRLAAAQARARWTVAFGGEADLVLAGTGSGGSSSLRASEPAQPDRPAVLLDRPVQAHALMALLAACARRRGAGPASASPAAPVAWPRDARFRLRRWPPGALLDPPYRRKLADHLLMRDADMLALAKACRVPLLRCCEFIAALQAAGLLLVDGQPAPAAQPGGPR